MKKSMYFFWTAKKKKINVYYSWVFVCFSFACC